MFEIMESDEGATEHGRSWVQAYTKKLINTKSKAFRRIGSIFMGHMANNGWLIKVNRVN